MGIVRWALVAAMASLAAFAWSQSFTPGIHAAASARYQCPMHPAVMQRGPGSCPICGMGLVKVSDAPSVQDSAVAGAAAPVPTAGAPVAASGPSIVAPSAQAPVAPAGLAAVKIAPGRAQLAGVRTEKATRKRLKPQLRAAGAVAVDDSATAVVDARVSGWVAQSRLAQVGDHVEKGQVLAAISGPEVETAQEVFLAATHRATQPAAGVARALGTSSLLAGESNALRRLGIADRDIEALSRRGRPFDAVPVRSPTTGFIAKKAVVSGQFVQSGSQLFEIVDLRKVWVLATVSEADAARLSPGQRALFSVPAFPGESFVGKLQSLYPALDAETRTLQARMELDNRGLRLRPGMSGDLRIEVQTAESLTVPAEAVIDTGDAQYVFVAREGGRFEPRVVRPGASDGDRVQILDGLADGEAVVTRGGFLIDSESRLRAAIEAFAPADDAAQDALAQQTR
jgi:Cu(I)/Ag(I) efflux system membrane fusion protein